MKNERIISDLAAAALGAYAAWTPTENVEEAFWKCADMTEQARAISHFGIVIPARTNCLSEWACTANLGDRDAVLQGDALCEGRKIIKILSYGGMDMRYCKPSWRG